MPYPDKQSTKAVVYKTDGNQDHTTFSRFTNFNRFSDKAQIANEGGSLFGSQPRLATPLVRRPPLVRRRLSCGVKIWRLSCGVKMTCNRCGCRSSVTNQTALIFSVAAVSCGVAGYGVQLNSLVVPQISQKQYSINVSSFCTRSGAAVQTNRRTRF